MNTAAASHRDHPSYYQSRLRNISIRICQVHTRQERCTWPRARNDRSWKAETRREIGLGYVWYCFGRIQAPYAFMEGEWRDYSGSVGWCSWLAAKVLYRFLDMYVYGYLCSWLSLACGVALQREPFYNLFKHLRTTPIYNCHHTKNIRPTWRRPCLPQWWRRYSYLLVFSIFNFQCELDWISLLEIG